MRVGIDLIKAERFENKTPSFFEKYFDKSEIEYAKKRKNFSETIGGIFASKEAFLKALGIGVFRGIKLKNIILNHDENGAPFFEIPENIKKRYGITNCSISISHDAGFCMAICIIN